VARVLGAVFPSDGGAMTATTKPTRPDPTRAGAVWVTGTGAFLLLAAASVFVAVNWGAIPDTVKLGVLLLLTGGFLLAGRSLKASLPATAGALFHLGAFLVPVDVAAIGVHTELDWSTLLLIEGLVSAAVLGWAAVIERSVVLRSAFAISVVALAGGIGATTALPAPLVLVGFAVAALAWRQDGLATGWAALAGLAPLLTFVDDLTFEGADVLERLGLTGEQPRVAAVLTGVGAAVVLAIVGRRRGDAGLVLLGVALGSVGAIASWTGEPHDGTTTIIGLASAFLLVELVAYATRDDEFWRVPSGLLARVAEWLAGLGALTAAVPILLAPVEAQTSSQTALATMVLGAGWLVADRRRGTRGLVLGALAAAVCLASAVASASADDRIVAASLVVLAAVALASGHRAGSAIAVLGASWAPVVALESLPTLVAVGVAGSLVVAEAAVRRANGPQADERTADIAEQWAWILSPVALLPGAIAMSGFIAETDAVVTGLVGGAVLATAVAAVLDRGRVTGDLPLGTLARVGSVAVLAGAASLPAADVAMVAVAVGILSVVDAVRLRDPHVALGASVAVPVAIGALARSVELSIPSTGVVLAVSAAVLVGLGSLVERRWSLPLLVSAGIATFAGLGLAAHDAAAFADAVMIISGIGLAASVVHGRIDGVVLATLTMTSGIWLRLAEADVTASEPYLAPVALLLVGAGVRARSMGTSSWIAYGPVVTVFGGAALAERMTGGAGWHAVAAGAVGVLAVAAGGYRKLAAPLFLGTGLLVVLVGYETLAITAALPTWSWLALGGTALLAAGVAMERKDVGPIETGKRLVDVVDERFA
jgi:hypothetical protein